MAEIARVMFPGVAIRSDSFRMGSAAEDDEMHFGVKLRKDGAFTDMDVCGFLDFGDAELSNQLLVEVFRPRLGRSTNPLQKHFLEVFRPQEHSVWSLMPHGEEGHVKWERGDNPGALARKIGFMIEPEQAKLRGFKSYDVFLFFR